MVRITRKFRAAELLDRLTRGPSYDMTFLHVDTGIVLTEEQQAKLQEHLKSRYRLWSESWILHSIKVLIKELQ